MTTHKTPETAQAPAPAAEAAASFNTLGISEKVLAVLTKNSFITPTPIQGKVIPLGIQGKDIIGIAQTGTGKTLGFGIPMIERILANPNGRGLVLLPTRELALQVDETIRKIGYALGIRTAVLIGGDSMYRQVKELRNGPDIVIATPGRLIDHLKQGNIKFDRVSVLVLDEADHMFDIGFAPQIKEIMAKVPKTRQTLLFSATMPNEIAKLAVEHMQLPLRIEMAPAGTSSANVEQEIIVVNRGAKFNLLVKTLGEVSPGTPVLVFTRTKHGAKDIAHDLRNIGTTATEIHSNRTLGQRREALDGFKKHKYQVLVATDIAARGIDVKDIGLVVNYDLPEQSEDYVHRIGRTGRGGKHGKAVSFATPDQKYDIVAIERLIKKPIPMKSHEGAAMGAAASGPSRSFRGRGGRGGGFRPRSSFAPRAGGSSYSSSRSFAPRSTSTAGSSAAPRAPYRSFSSPSSPRAHSPYHIGSAPRGPRTGGSFGRKPNLGAFTGRSSGPRTGGFKGPRSSGPRAGGAPRGGSYRPR
ncbi:MAG TPA: DEAD/DEAH box helicase [Candidatus Paceibacterota bacterium]